jgi:hypothetical protein
MISDLTHQLLAAGLSRGQIRSERAIGPPGKWEVASPALRHFRRGTTVFFATFVLLVAVSTIGRAIGA